MESVAEYLSMGGYASFVWPAFAVCAVVMVALAVASRRALARERRLLESLNGGRRAPRGARAESAEAQGAVGES